MVSSSILPSFWENEQTIVKGDLVTTVGKETVVTLGSNYPTAGEQFITGIHKFGKSKMETGYVLHNRQVIFANKKELETRILKK